jgi:hypothetical protein
MIILHYTYNAFLWWAISAIWPYMLMAKCAEIFNYSIFTAIL